jgi:hypothetical protein
MKQELKQFEKDMIVGRPCSASVHGKKYSGYIQGRKLDAPIFMAPGSGIAFSVSWELADRAVNSGKEIIY